MAEELTLEQMADKLNTLTANMQTFQANQEKFFKAMEENKDKDDEKTAKRANRIAAVKKAMDENKDDEEKMEAAILKAMDMDPEDHKNHKEAKKAESEDKDKEHVAAIIDDKKNELIQKILTANSYQGGVDLKSIEERLKKASIEQVKQEWNILEPFFGGVKTQATTSSQDAFIPYYADRGQSNIDKNQLSASSPDSEFSKFSTQELLEEARS